MNQEDFKAACVTMMGAAFSANVDKHQNFGSEYINNARGTLSLEIDDGFWKAEFKGQLRTVNYYAPGIRIELWPQGKEKDFSRVYDTLSFLVHRQIVWHKKSCEIMRTHKFMIEQIRKAYVVYEEHLDLPNPVIECYLFDGGPRLFEIRRNGVQFAHHERGTKIVTKLDEIPMDTLEESTAVFGGGSKYGMRIFLTHGAYFISSGVEGRPHRGRVYSPKFPHKETA
jgi:hypothetical protein